MIYTFYKYLMVSLVSCLIPYLDSMFGFDLLCQAFLLLYGMATQLGVFAFALSLPIATGCGFYSTGIDFTWFTKPFFLTWRIPQPWRWYFMNHWFWGPWWDSYQDLVYHIQAHPSPLICLYLILFSSFFWAIFFLIYRSVSSRAQIIGYYVAIVAATKILLISVALVVTSVNEEYRFLDYETYAETLYTVPITHVVLGYDRISLVFVFLSALTTFFAICVAYDLPSKKELSRFFSLIFLTQFFLTLTFIANELFIFYIFFEASMFPTFLIIGYWGSGVRSKRAAFYFFLYTMLGSVFFLFALMLIYFPRSLFRKLFSVPFRSELPVFGIWQPWSTVYLSSMYTFNMQVFIFACIFIAFAMKVPIMPFHRWLPEAHVEAPTSGSVLLAGILLKLGGYGLLRSTMWFPDAARYLAPYVFTLSFVSALYSSIAIFYQHDLKKIVAYASIGHMNYVVLGIFTLSYNGILGAIYLMVSHAFSSVALFILVGFLYYRYGSRNLFRFADLITYMPIFSFFLFMASLANFSFPGTGGFIGELGIFLALLSMNWALSLLMAISAILNVVYTMWLFNRLCLRSSATLKDHKPFLVGQAVDLYAREVWLMAILIGGVIVIGLFPNYLLIGLKFCVSCMLLTVG